MSGIFISFKACPKEKYFKVLCIILSKSFKLLKLEFYFTSMTWKEHLWPPFWPICPKLKSDLHSIYAAPSPDCLKPPLLSGFIQPLLPNSFLHIQVFQCSLLYNNPCQNLPHEGAVNERMVVLTQVGHLWLQNIFNTGSIFKQHQDEERCCRYRNNNNNLPSIPRIRIIYVLFLKYKY